MPVISALERQDDYEFKVSLSYIESLKRTWAT
jgi:hypothetical protein